MVRVPHCPVPGGSFGKREVSGGKWEKGLLKKIYLCLVGTMRTDRYDKQGEEGSYQSTHRGSV
jgi:hypothetical protein